MWVQGYVEVGRWFDAEHCPDPVPTGFDGAFVYAGGSSAAHAWTDAELLRVQSMPRIPIWVPTPGRDDPHVAARQFIDWLLAHKVPQQAANGGRPVHVAWDMETGREPDPAWLKAAADDLDQAGYWNLVYGPLAYLFNQPQRDGYWVANPTGSLHMYQRPGVRATQYAFDVQVPGGLIDESAVARDLAAQTWLPA